MDFTTPRKKRRAPQEEDDSVLTPKKIRNAPPTPPATVRRNRTTPLPPHLARISALHASLEQTLSLALASSPLAPSETGQVPNVITHMSLNTVGLASRLDVEDLKRLVWIWEWNGEAKPATPPPSEQQDDNPFLDQPKTWTRGGMGLIVTPTTHLEKGLKRVPAYGIGIEISLSDSGGGGGMGAVGRWMAGGEGRKKELREKLAKWASLHPKTTTPIPAADLPVLAKAREPSSLTRLFSASTPSSTSASPSVSPTKRQSPAKAKGEDFAVPFPINPSSRPQTPSTNRTATVFPFQTPSRKEGGAFPQTPSSSSSGSDVFPQTPTNQTSAGIPETPTSSRRAALYERLRKKSLTTPKGSGLISLPTSGSGGGKIQKLVGPEEMRRRCLLGRLGDVAEGVWMLFASPQTQATPTTSVSRKRRTMPTRDVVNAVVKSSKVPISDAEAQESLHLLCNLCPFFLRELNVEGDDWLEMPASAGATPPSPGRSSPVKGAPMSPGRTPSKFIPVSPGRGEAAAEEVRTRSPKRIRVETGGLREVRERIRKELDGE